MTKKARLDKLWADKVKARDGKCIVCEKTGGLEAHHVLGKASHRLRYCLANGVTLCNYHHIRGIHSDNLRVSTSISNAIKLHIGTYLYESLLSLELDNTKLSLTEAEERLT